MTKVIDVLWLLEHVAREFDVACAVKFLAKNKFGIKTDEDLTKIFNKFVYNRNFPI